jgi:ribonucleotide reductase alpha subunit
MATYDGKEWIAEFLQNRTYGAVLDGGRKETRTETIDRTRDMHIKKFPQFADLISEAFSYVHRGQVVPSMRSLQFGGEAIEKANARMYNCAFANLTSWDDFHDAFYLLMCGTGFGYSVKWRHVSQLPAIKKPSPHAGVITYTVDDSKEGWADALRFLLNNPNAEFNYGLVRPKGSLISSGGTASGPEALQETLESIRSILQKAVGRKLSTIEAHDIMCFVANGVVVGGVRRAALICLFDSGDIEMNKAKSGKWWEFAPQRARANNSAVIHLSPSCSEGEIDDQIESIIGFMLDSGSGEPGISLTNNPDWGFNPCVTGDTPILTRSGYVPIQEVVDQEIDVWNGFEFSKVTPKITGENQKILEVSLSNGRTLKCTPYHKFYLSRGYKGEEEIVEAKDLKLGEKLIKCEFPVIEEGTEDCATDMYTRGFYAADGNKDNDYIRLYDEKINLLPFLNVTSNERVFENRIKSTKFINTRTQCQLFGKDFVPFKYNLTARLAWFAGFLDGDGCELVEGGTQVSSTNLQFLQDVQLMLQTCGVDSKIVERQKEGYRRLPDGNGEYKEYWCKEAKALCVSAYQIQKLKNLGMVTNRLKFNKKPDRDASRFVQVTGIRELEGVEDYVYCFDEPKRHLGVFNGIITGQCHEIALRDGGLCNLTEINLKKCKTLSDISNAVAAATLIGTLQASYTDFEVLQPKWTRNAREEALLGVSATGQADNWELWKKFLDSGAAGRVARINKMVAEMLGIETANRITTTKPSGSTSAWLGCTSGIHADHDDYYIRHIRMEKSHKIIEAVAKSKYPFVEVDQMDSDKLVIGFPVKATEGSILKNNETAIQLLDRAKFVHDKWIRPGHIQGDNTHNVSLTVEYKADEKDDIIQWMKDNKKHYAGISFLPRTESIYTQMPFQSITKEEYESMVAKITQPIDYTSVDWTGIVDDRMGELACVNGACEIE